MNEAAMVPQIAFIMYEIHMVKYLKINLMNLPRRHHPEKACLSKTKGTDKCAIDCKCKGYRLACRLESPTVRSFELCFVTSLSNSALQTAVYPVFQQSVKPKRWLAEEIPDNYWLFSQINHMILQSSLQLLNSLVQPNVFM